MTQQLDLIKTLSTMANTLRDSLLRIDALESKIAGYDDYLRRADLEKQAGKLALTSNMYPKTRRVVFIGRNYFGDNIKYAFLDFLNAADSTDCDVWFLPPDEQQEALVTAQGLQCFPCHFQAWTAEHIINALETYLVVTCDCDVEWRWPDPRILSFFRGAKKIQLWHGIPLKDVALRCVHNGDMFGMLDSELMVTSGHFDAFVGTSQSTEQTWRRLFAFDRYAPVGLPRNDALMREATAHDLINVDMDAYERLRLAKQAGTPVYVYTPTFRDNIGSAWFPPEGLLHVFTASSLSHKAVILVNMHPYEQHDVPNLAQRYPELLFLKPGTDLYPVLRFADALITDYSSLMFDFLLLDRPIILYRPDHELYTTQLRTISDAKLADPPGVLCYTAADLESVLEGLLKGEDHFKVNRRKLRETWFDHPDGKSGARVTRLILECLQSAPRNADQMLEG